MPWRDVSVMDERLEFVRLAGLEGFGFTFAKEGVLNGHQSSLIKGHRRSRHRNKYGALRKFGNEVVQRLHALAAVAAAHMHGHAAPGRARQAPAGQETM